MDQLVQPILRFAKTAPKIVAALWFSGCGLLAATVMFIGPAMRAGPMVVYSSIVLPTLSAGLVGYLYGASLLDNRRIRTCLQALLRGLLLTVLTFVVFALLLVVSYSVTHEARIPQLPSFIAMLLVVLIAGLVATLPVIVIVGLIGATTLFKFGRYVVRSSGGAPRI